MRTSSINSSDSIHVDYIMSESEGQDCNNIFNEIKIKIVNSLYIEKEKYPYFFESIKNSSSLNDLINSINVYLEGNKSKNGCSSFIEMIRQDEFSKINEKYEIKEIHGHFYPIPWSNKGAGEVSSVNESTNPFDEIPPEVERLLELYRTNVIGKYKGGKDIELGSDILTVEGLCHEINKVYGRINSKTRSNLKPILIDFAKHDDVRDVIGTQKKK
ncbi:MFS transporter permease [Yersinia frederiksenii]|nr:MFS transporter permease [Yersinia frederiksenii]